MIEGILLFCGILLIPFLIISVFIIMDEDEDNYWNWELISQIKERKECYNNLLTGNRTSKEYQMLMGPELYERFQNELNNRAMSMTSNEYDSLRDYETYKYYQRNPMYYSSYDNTCIGYSASADPYNYTTTQITTNTNMNTTVSNQEQQMESAVKYLSDRREKASELVELTKKEHIALVEELAELKAKVKSNQELIRVESADEYHDGNIITYTGKDKALADITKSNNNAQTEIRDLQQQLTILNERLAEVEADKDKTIAKEEKRLQEFYADKFEKDNAKLIKENKKQLKDYENAIDELNEKIQQANDRNKILSDMNNRYVNTLTKMLDYVSDKGTKFFKRKFRLNSLLTANNEYRVTVPYGFNSNSNRDMYINSATGASYWA